jgi:hypothetical protein
LEGDENPTDNGDPNVSEDSICAPLLGTQSSTPHAPKHEKKHALDKFMAVVWTLTLIATGTAAFFTYCEVGVMQDQERRQLRAYITVSELTQTASGQGQDAVYVVTPVIRNTGLTPATHVTITNVTPSNEWLRHSGGNGSPNYSYIDWKVGAPEDPDDVVDDTGIMTVPPVVIGAGSTLTASSLEDHLSASASLDAQSNKIGRFFYGSIHYDDVFGLPHITKYCFRIDDAEINAGSIIPLQSVCSHWNCIDDDCKIDRTSYDQDAEKAQKSQP